MTGYRKLPGPWTTTWSKRYLSAVHPLTYDLLWVRYLFDPTKFGVLGANDPWIETFHNFLSKICVSTTIYVSWSNLVKIGRCEVAKKSSRIAYKKYSGVGDTFEPPISTPLSQSRFKFCERCRPLSCACVPTFVQIGCGLPDLFRKESKKVNTI